MVKAVSLQEATTSSILVPVSTFNDKTPISAETPTGAETTTAEAAMIADNLIIRLSAVNLNRRNHSDLPQLPKRMQAPRARP